MTDVPLVEFFCKPLDQGRLTRFAKISDEDSAIVNEFIKYGFDPVIETQTTCTNQAEMNALAFCYGDQEMRDDWETLPRSKVFCLIRWNTNDAIEPSLKRFAKHFFECLLGVREYPRMVTRSQQDWIDRLRPFKTKETLLASEPLVGEVLPDGRTCLKIEGGERALEISEFLNTLDTTKLLENLPRNCNEMIMG